MTEEGIIDPAPLWRRLAALFYDVLLIFVTVLLIGAIVATVLARVLGLDYIPPGSILANGLFAFNILLAYLLVAWFWCHGGQTLGMRAWRLKLVNLSEQRITWPQSLMRFAAGLVSGLCFGVGYWIAAIDPKKRTWHDRFSATKVVQLRK